MAKTLVDIREMLKKLTRDVCKSPKSWMNYLNTASRFYRYSFFDTLLIHAQRPEAIACASMPEWNKIMKRWINQGAKGIALLDDSGNRLRLRYVFDIKDTRPLADARPLKLWQMDYKKESMIKAHLRKTYGVEVKSNERLPETLKTLARDLTAENISQAMYELDRNKDNSYLSTMEEVALLKHFTKLVESSVAYILMKRCGYHPEEHMNIDNFQMISWFNDISVLPYLGEAIHTITEPVLMDIRNVVNRYDRVEEQRHTLVSPHKSLKERIIAERPKTDALVPQRAVKPQIQSEMSL